MRFKNNSAASGVLAEDRSRNITNKENAIRDLSKRLGACFLAAVATAMGLAAVANAELQVFDHTSAPIGVGYDANRNMAVLYMDGTFKLHTDGIIEADKTDDAIWFKCLDFMAAGGAGYKGYTGLFAYTGSGAGVAAHPYNGDVGGDPLFEVEHTHDPDLGLEGTDTEVHSGLSFTNGHAVMYANGGLSSSPGWGGYSVWADRKGFCGRGFVGFTLEEADGTHYGWADVGLPWSPTSMTIYGWGYESTAWTAAQLTYDPPAATGDFDGDGDIDAADIDMLCDNLGDVAFDLDSDGDADEDDMIYLIVNLVELTDGSGRVGSVRGDFNLDGFVDGTDLALMKVAFGQPDQTYADGNANCDALVDGTDLAILKVNMGFIAPPTGGGSAGLATGGVPEPATLSLLALGATGLAAKRRRKS